MITKKDVERSFDRFVDAVGGRPAESYNDVGGLRLDYNSAYGGWSIEQIVNQGGGVSQPFGMSRLSTAQMYQALHFAMHTLEFTRAAQQQAA